MRSKEDYVPYIALALGLTVAVLVSFQLYLWREPGRIAGVETNDRAADFTAGQQLFKKNCTLCHGDNGEGTPGRPALNDKPFLANTTDDTIFSVVSSGVPNTEMPSWNQSHGGPLTDEDIRQVVVFIRAWEPTAPDRRATPLVGDVGHGKTLYTNLCVACHGKDGSGSDRAPALNDPIKLAQFDDSWYRDTITKGRPAQGMPTWGTVLSPQQTADLLALIDSWRNAAQQSNSTSPATGVPTSPTAPTQTPGAATPSSS